MTRITQTYERLNAENRKGLNIFISAGDPDFERSCAIMTALPEAGADFIELGMPFTDPVADGPAVQAAGKRALDNGASMQNTFKILQQFRSKNDKTPVILMGYMNPVHAYGIQDFVHDAKEAGADGLLIVDLPTEEDNELANAAQNAGLDFIKLVTPTTDEARLKKILKSASGFLYYVSITGVTGTKSANQNEVAAHIQEIKKHTKLPIAVGFGIKTPDDAANMSKICDSIVVGSAICDIIKENQEDTDLPNLISKAVKHLSAAL